MYIQRQMIKSNTVKWFFVLVCAGLCKHQSSIHPPTSTFCSVVQLFMPDQKMIMLQCAIDGMPMMS